RRQPSPISTPRKTLQRSSRKGHSSTPARENSNTRNSRTAATAELPPRASSRQDNSRHTKSLGAASSTERPETPTKTVRSISHRTTTSRRTKALVSDSEEETPPSRVPVTSPTKTVTRPTERHSRNKKSDHLNKSEDGESHDADSQPISGPSQSNIITSPSKTRIPGQTSTLTSLPQSLPTSLHEVLHIQKDEIRRALLEPPVLSLPPDGISSPTKGKGKGKEPIKESSTPQATDTLTALLKGTTERGEGNSCLVMGPRGSGKSRVVSQALSRVAHMDPIVVRLSGEAQLNDKLAMREMARQLVKQTGENFVIPEDDEAVPGHNDMEPGISGNMVPAAHLPTLISTLKTLPRPTIVILESFELFTAHARQALLYCLLDTVQSCRPGAWERPEAGSSGTISLGAGGVAVIGVTSRVDCLNLLEKRVKSRFSGRLIRVGVIESWETYLEIARSILDPDIQNSISISNKLTDEGLQEWRHLWSTNVENFLANRDTIRILKDTFNLSTDIRTLCKIMTPVILEMKPNCPWLKPANLRDGAEGQIAPPRFGYLKDLPYPSLALLIATFHVSNTGHDVFNFEMLWSKFSKQVDRTSSMPVMVGGASVGMIRLKREVILGAFDNLIALKIFLPIGPSVASAAKQFVKYRCAAERFEISDAVEKSGNLRLKTWLKRPAE
ncbi:hypothetical protein FRC03_003875, partial [Tulasnella sp. 419]